MNKGGIKYQKQRGNVLERGKSITVKLEGLKWV